MKAAGSFAKRNFFIPLLCSALVWAAIFGAVYTGSLLLIPAVGILQYHLAILTHDGFHGSLAHGSALNEFFTRWFLAAPTGVPLGTARANHLHHHRAVGTPSDQDRVYYDQSARTRRGLLLWIAAGFSGLRTFYLFSKTYLPHGNEPEARESGKLLDLAAVAFTQLVLAVLLWRITGLYYAYLLWWVLPLITVMAGLNAVRNCLEHANPEGLAASGTQLLTFRSNALERLLLAPFCMNYHAEHHQCPYVPFYRLPELRRSLENGEHEIPGYLNRLRFLLRRQAQN